jgi:hypothetical protein
MVPLHFAGDLTHAAEGAQRPNKRKRVEAEVEEEAEF